LPDVRSDADCRRLIASLQLPVYRACFTLIYAYGLRISEAVTLPISAVDSRQMVLHIIGKGNKERVLPLNKPILSADGGPRELWKTHRSPRWLFPSRRPLTHLPDASARAAITKARDACGFNSDFGPHSLRKTSAYCTTFRRMAYFQGNSCCPAVGFRSWRPWWTASTAV
jgi:integrase/recombinase XerD